MKKLISLILIAAMALSACLSLASCSGKGEMSYWNIVKRENSLGDRLEYYAAYKLTRSKPIKEIWVNVSAIEDDEVNFNLTYATSETINTAKEETVAIKSSELSQNGGWVRIAADKSYTYNYFELATVNQMHFNELVFVDTEDKCITVSLMFAGIRPNKSSQSKEQLTASELTEKNAINSALNTVDEQDKFKLSDMVITSSSEDGSVSASQTSK